MSHSVLLLCNETSGRKDLEDILAGSSLKLRITTPGNDQEFEGVQHPPPEIIVLDDQYTTPLTQLTAPWKAQKKELPLTILLSNPGAIANNQPEVFRIIHKPVQKQEFIYTIVKAVEFIETRHCLTGLPYAFMVVTPAGNIEWANEGLKKIFGFDPETFYATPGNTIFSLPPAGDIAALFNKCLQERCMVDKVCQLQIKTGELQWLQIFITPLLNSEEQVEKLYLMANDISHFIAREEELLQQNRNMQEIANGLGDANALLEIQKHEINQQKLIIEEEQQKSEKLLLNILPFEVARQLKSKGRAGTRQYKLVSVIFADFKGFSNISKTLDPKDLVSILDSYFATFDEITGKHYIEKIKTIGDAYMCAGGLPLSNKSNPVDAVLAGLEIQHYMNTLNDTKVLNNLPLWELRLGIHTGSVVAGVVGKKRFAYDIWGDTVNIASRMEQSGHVGMVNISGITHEYIADFFYCDYRGKIETKNLGKIDMYFVNRIKTKFSADKFGILPNEVMINLVNKL